MNNYINKEPDYESNFSDHGVRKYDNTTGRFIYPVLAKRKYRLEIGNALWDKYYALSPYRYSANPKNQRFFLRLKSGLTAFESISNCAVNNPVNASDGNGLDAVTINEKHIIMNNGYDTQRNRIHEVFHTLFFSDDNAKFGIGSYKRNDMYTQIDINTLINNPKLPEAVK